MWRRGPERDHLTGSGRDVHQVFDTPLGKVGMLICWDLAFPEAFRELIANGAKMVIIPTFWTLKDCNEKGLALNPSAEALFLDSMLTARAFENTCGMCSIPSLLPRRLSCGKSWRTGSLTYAISCRLRKRRWTTRKRICGAKSGGGALCGRVDEIRELC
jgi:predicted amidohydrolase